MTKDKGFDLDFYFFLILKIGNSSLRQSQIRLLVTNNFNLTFALRYMLKFILNLLLTFM